MDASPGEDQPETADPDILLRMRTSVADAAFVADGIALGLLLKWAEWALPPEDLPPHRTARGAQDYGMRATAGFPSGSASPRIGSATTSGSSTKPTG
jgi:hypothetical protein